MPFPAILALPMALAGVGVLVAGTVWSAVKLGEKSDDWFDDSSGGGGGGGGGSRADDVSDHGQAHARTMDTWASLDHTQHHSRDPGSPF